MRHKIVIQTMSWLINKRYPTTKIDKIALGELLEIIGNVKPNLSFHELAALTLYLSANNIERDDLIENFTAHLAETILTYA